MILFLECDARWDEVQDIVDCTGLGIDKALEDCLSRRSSWIASNITLPICDPCVRLYKRNCWTKDQRRMKFWIIDMFVRQRVTFKLTTLLHKCLNGQAPNVPGWLLSTDWRPSLRNEICGDLDTPRATCEIHIRRQIINFADAGPSIWNS